MQALQNYHHPNIEIIWNFFPLELFVWNPIRAVLNVFFLVFYIPALPIITLWNFGPEAFTMIVTNCTILLGMGFIVLGGHFVNTTTTDFWAVYGVLAGIDLIIFSLPINILT